MAQEHSFATPAPAGLAALAVACFGFGAVMLGKVAVEGLPLLAAWLIGGFVIQIVVAIVELKDNDATGGNIFLFFSAFFMLTTAISLISKFLMIQFGIHPAHLVEGWCWMAGAAFVTVATPCYAKSSSLMFVMVLMFNVILWMIVGMDTGWYGNPLIMKKIVGWLMVVAGWCAIYMAGAVLCNTVYGKVILPIPKPLIK